MSTKPRKAWAVSWAVLFAALALGAAGARAQEAGHIGYVYPAGGRAGDFFWITVGGQNLQNTTGVRITGEGVRMAGMRHMARRGAPLYPAQIQELRRRLNEIRQKRSGVALAETAATPAAPGAPKVRATLPHNPLLDSLDDLTEADLQIVAKEYLDPTNREMTKEALADRMMIELMIDPDAAPGDRQLRLVSPGGLSNPLCFQVGTLPEFEQKELDPAEALTLPALVNGQILHAEVDRIRFRARGGQHLVIRTQARHLIPYMADAVPGWFQAVAALYNAEGRQLACTDHYLFDPDPVLFYTVPADGEYQLEIRDSIYRGREDFVYRVSIGEQPFITQVFPLGGSAGVATVAAISGWNLAVGQLTLDTGPDGGGIRETAWRGDGGPSNDVLYAVDSLPECTATETNHCPETAQPVALPILVNGRIRRSGQADYYRFEGRAGGEVVAEVKARRLGSPLDSYLRLMDASGKVLAWNDDYPDKECGPLTFQADSWLRATLPADGTYSVCLTDAQNAGSDAHAYRLRISEPQPDFALLVTPSGINLQSGRQTQIRVYAVRKDGFDGDIQIALKDAPAGFTLSGATIPHGRESVRMTLVAPKMPNGRTTALQMVGRARIGGGTVVRPAVPADNLMQAFAYWHLVPAQELAATVTGNSGSPFSLPKAGGVVKIPAGGETQVQFNGQSTDFEFALIDPPKGVSLGDAAAVKGGVKLTVKDAADAGCEKPGYADNLIIEAYKVQPIPNPVKGGPPLGKRRVWTVPLPAIAFEIVPAAK